MQRSSYPANDAGLPEPPVPFTRDPIGLHEPRASDGPPAAPGVFGNAVLDALHRAMGDGLARILQSVALTRDETL
jgi:hypothetical protein